MENVSAKRKLRQTPRRHGHAKHGQVTPEYNVWHSMINRCSRPNHRSWPRYGGRGIKVCERWQTFENFLADMGQRPSLRHQLDRINNDGNYEPSNCRWVTASENSRNRSSAALVTIGSETKCVAEWSALSGISAARIASRLRLGWDPQRAVFETPSPPKKGLNAGESHGLAKLTEAIVRDVRLRHANGERQRAIASSLGLSAQTINNLVRRKSWKHVA